MRRQFLTFVLAVFTAGILCSFRADASDIPDGTLPGEFSVSAGRTVRFSRGNLWYDGSAFHFEYNQYAFNDSWCATHISHFYWSRRVSVVCAQIYVHPGVREVEFITNAPGNPELPDSAFTVDGVRGKYRVLSSSEWKYLFNVRTVNGGRGEGKSYSNNVTYGGRRGLVLYPDNYSGEMLSGTVDSLPGGVVFLPATGIRCGSNVSYVGLCGLYWASDSDEIGYAGYLFFDRINVGPDYYGYRYYCSSVRLVTE